MFSNALQFQTSQCSPRLRRKSTLWYVVIVARDVLSPSNGPKRILKGHPNIVHLIDAAWNRTSNGVYEVFILMEYCPGSLHSIMSPLT